MTDARTRRRRLWRWAVVVWAVTAAVGGGLTLWLRDAAEPPGPPGRHETEVPAPLLGVEVDDEGSCSPYQSGSGPDRTVVACAYTESR